MCGNISPEEVFRLTEQGWSIHLPGLPSLISVPLREVPEYIISMLAVIHHCCEASFPVKEPELMHFSFTASAFESFAVSSVRIEIVTRDQTVHKFRCEVAGLSEYLNRTHVKITGVQPLLPEPRLEVFRSSSDINVHSLMVGKYAVVHEIITVLKEISLQRNVLGVVSFVVLRRDSASGLQERKLAITSYDERLYLGTSRPMRKESLLVLLEGLAKEVGIPEPDSFAYSALSSGVKLR